MTSRKDSFEFDLQLLADKVDPLPVGDESVRATVATGDDFDATLDREHAAANAVPFSPPADVETNANADATDVADVATEVDEVEDDESPNRAVRETAQEKKLRLKAARDAAAATEQPPVVDVADKAAKDKTATDAAAAAAAAAAAKPADAIAKPAELAADEMIALAPNLSWKRSEVILAMNQREAMLRERTPIVEEINTWRDVFKIPAAQAKEVWAPLIQEIGADPELGEYLEDCRTHYHTRKGTKRAGAAAGNQPGVPSAYGADADLRRDLDQVKTQLTQERATAAQNAVRVEMDTLAARFPALKDPTVRSFLAQRALQGNRQNPSYTLTTAAEELADYLNRLHQQPVGGAVDPPRAAVAVPALTGGQGATPNGARPQPSLAPVAFKSPDAAEADWLRNRRAYGFS